MVDTLCSTRPTLRIGGEEIATGQVQSRFLSLDSGHLEYVFDCMRRNTTQIRNIRAYLLTALYNAPATMSNYYQAEVQHERVWGERHFISGPHLHEGVALPSSLEIRTSQYTYNL